MIRLIGGALSCGFTLSTRDRRQRINDRKHGPGTRPNGTNRVKNWPSPYANWQASLRRPFAAGADVDAEVRKPGEPRGQCHL
jgi:hypothetical protein